jgi:hypothetical protein
MPRSLPHSATAPASNAAPDTSSHATATASPYLKDLFGGFNVSAIHGRLLTAWSGAGIIGLLIVNGILDH